jgi:hypothetical protein
MWDEDLRYQKAVYQFLIGSVAILTLVAMLVSLLERSWEPLRSLFFVFGIILAALCIYAATIWFVAHIVQFATHLAGKKFRNRKHAP